MRGSSDMTHDAAVSAGSYYTIPFRALMPANVSNLMFCGRIISADAVAFASVRGMPQCMSMGQAAGTAAAMMIENDAAVQELDLSALVADLTRQGIHGLGNSSLI